MDRLEELLQRAESRLEEPDYALVKALAESYTYLTALVGDKATTIARLRKLLFGAKTEKTAAVVPPSSPPEPPPQTAELESSAAETTPAAGIATAEATSPDATEPTRVPGHGRLAAEDYTVAEKINIPHASLTPGDPCPDCGRGTVYETNRPGVLVRLVGQAPILAKVYSLQKLRCNLCGEVFTAALPEGVGDEKYDATAGSMIALLKYGTGVPFQRAETLQANVGIPLPASTQWDLVAAQAERAEPVFDELICQAAQGEILHNDDTTVKILALMGERAQTPVADDAAEASSPERKGLFTSGIVAIGNGRKIALFLSGRRHAGENLAEVLQRRAPERPPPIQMCDALSRNLPANLKTLLANCLAHGRRQFVDVIEQFPRECAHVLESVAVVYRNDAVVREHKLSHTKRLRYHQEHSGPVMKGLHKWLTQRMEQRLVEPNSGLGKASAYLLRHWEKLTLFLRVPGAPLDNNICERALKKAIRHRRNSLFYKTENGARVGDLFMSLIHTCELNGVNPFDYLTELERHAEQAALQPQAWLPWNYQTALEGTPHE
jgi:hypothetical protein